MKIIRSSKTPSKSKIPLLDCRQDVGLRRAQGKRGALSDAPPCLPPQLAQQIKPTLNFQYAGDVPVYATSHVFSASGDKNQYLDMTNVMFCETPWLLDTNNGNALRRQVVQQWPQAAGSSGSAAPWMTRVGAAIAGSSALRSPAASSASIWRALPPGQ